METKTLLSLLKTRVEGTGAQPAVALACPLCCLCCVGLVFFFFLGVVVGLYHFLQNVLSYAACDQKPASASQLAGARDAVCGYMTDAIPKPSSQPTPASFPTLSATNTNTVPRLEETERCDMGRKRVQRRPNKRSRRYRRDRMRGRGWVRERGQEGPLEPW